MSKKTTPKSVGELATKDLVKTLELKLKDEMSLGDRAALVRTIQILKGDR